MVSIHTHGTSMKRKKKRLFCHVFYIKLISLSCWIAFFFCFFFCGTFFNHFLVNSVENKVLPFWWGCPCHLARVVMSCCGWGGEGSCFLHEVRNGLSCNYLYPPPPLLHSPSPPLSSAASASRWIPSTHRLISCIRCWLYVTPCFGRTGQCSAGRLGWRGTRTRRKQRRWKITPPFFFLFFSWLLLKFPKNRLILAVHCQFGARKELLPTAFFLQYIK